MITVIETQNPDYLRAKQRIFETLKYDDIVLPADTPVRYLPHGKVYSELAMETEAAATPGVIVIASSYSINDMTDRFVMSPIPVTGAQANDSAFVDAAIESVVAGIDLESHEVISSKGHSLSDIVWRNDFVEQAGSPSLRYFVIADGKLPASGDLGFGTRQEAIDSSSGESKDFWRARKYEVLGLERIDGKALAHATPTIVTATMTVEVGIRWLYRKAETTGTYTAICLD